MAKGFVLAGTHSGVGKTTITLALLKALKERGHEVQPCKVGPDFIDPQFHHAVTGTPSYNLDSCLMGEAGVQRQLEQILREDQIVVVEGVMGLYDGMGSRKENGSTAWIARLLKLPVILIIDGAGMSTSAAAMVKGYEMYDPALKVAGVIINRISGEKHYQLIRRAIERDTGIPCLGWMAKDQGLTLKSRHLGLIPATEVEALKETLQKASEAAEKTLEIDRILEQAAILPVPLKTKENLQQKRDFRIGIAKDQAFHFYYPANLDWLKKQGCTLVEVSPMQDKHLPDSLDALYLGGGFPEIFGKELEANTSFRKDLKEKVQQGLPVYAECGGFQYLCQSLTDFQGNTWEMAGVFPGKAYMTNRLQRFGYGSIETNPEKGFFTESLQISGHEFHRGVVETQEPGVLSITKIQDPSEKRDPVSWKCGMTIHHAFGGFPHVFFESNPAYAMEWLKKIPGWQSSNKEAEEPERKPL